MFIIALDGDTLTVSDRDTEDVCITSSGDREIRTISIISPDGKKFAVHVEPGTTTEELALAATLDNPSSSWPVQFFFAGDQEGVVVTTPEGSRVLLEDY